MFFQKYLSRKCTRQADLACSAKISRHLYREAQMHVELILMDYATDLTNTLTTLFFRRRWVSSFDGRGERVHPMFWNPEDATAGHIILT